MLQKGDRGAARKELDLLARNFPDQPDLATKARKLVPDGDTLLAAPWGEFEGSQLNIKRDGVFTGEYLYYSVDPPRFQPGYPANPQAVILRWELNATNTHRSVQVETACGRSASLSCIRTTTSATRPWRHSRARPSISSNPCF